MDVLQAAVQARQAYGARGGPETAPREQARLPFSGDYTAALEARLRAANLDRAEEIPENLLADLDDYYTRLRLWEEAGGVDNASAPEPELPHALRGWDVILRSVHAGGGLEVSPQEEASPSRSPDFEAGYSAGVQAARLEEGEGPESLPSQHTQFPDGDLPLYYSSPHGEVRVSPAASGEPDPEEAPEGSLSVSESRGSTDAAEASLFSVEIILPTNSAESDVHRSVRLNRLLSDALRTAISQTERMGPHPGLDEIRPGAIEIDSQSSHSSEDVLQW
eukprot:2000463-Amphidinium_carterae.2